MIAEDLSALGVNWLLTYLLHSTILLGVTWAITSVLSSRYEALRDSLWKFALVAGVVSASGQLAFEPAGWSSALNLPSVVQIDLASLWSADPAGPSATISPPASAHGERAIADPVHTAQGPFVDPEDAAAGYVSPVPPAGTRQTMITWGASAMLHAAPWAMVLVLIASLASLGIAMGRLSSMLAGRQAIYDERIERTFMELCRRANVRRRVRLTHSPRLATPVAMGVWRTEICLPSRALDGLGAAELESMLAHELAHVVRRDPMWMLIGQAMTTLLFLQPLNFVARRQLREIAEYRCDAWAAAQCADVLPLARCLTEVATWLVQARRAGETRLLPGMSVRQSTLRRRVGRLLDEPAEPVTRGHAALAFGLIAALATLTVIAPGVEAVVRSDSAPEPEVILETPPKPTRADAPPSYRSDPLAALDDELSKLEREVAALRASAAGTPLESEIQPLVRQFEMKASAIRERRFRLQAWLDDEPVPEVPRAVQEH